MTTKLSGGAPASAARPTPSRPPAARGPEPSVHALFERQADRTPAAPAVVHPAGTLAYAALERRANRIARHLHRLGAGPDVPVGVFLPRTPDLVATLLGVLKSGAAYVPLDPAYPADRTGRVLADTAAPLVVTTAALAPRIPAGGARRVLLDTEAAEIDALPDARPDLPAFAEGLAWVIYTSGSTGRPKGVGIEHRNAVARLEWLKKAMRPAERARVLASTSVCFDVSAAELFGTLCWGGTVVLVENALALASLPPELEAGTASMVPSAAAELLRLDAIPASVRTLNLGGEPLPAALARGLYAAGRVQTLRNLYGPTEDTTYSTCEVVPADVQQMSVGFAVGGTRIHLLDASLGPVDEGAEGEVHLCGAGVSRGYLGRPAATAERWLPDPFGAPGSRMYRTGDRGRFRSDGRLDCLGRVDHQLKVRGYRVEPGEVEAVLREDPAVCEAVVIGIEERPGERSLVAYVASPGEAPSPDALRAFVAARLPDHMVPQAVVVLPALPRTPNGKVDRLALPAPVRPAVVEGAAQARTVDAPRTETEACVAAVWREVLGADGFGVRDDLFSLGGHSLRATQIVARLRSAFRVDLSLPAIFRCPTVQGLAAEIDALVAARPAGAAQADARRIPRARRDRPIPLSSAQEAIRFFQELSQGMRSYDFQGLVTFHGSLDVPALEGALGEMVGRHEIFRTVFPVRGGEPVQEIRDPWPVTLPVVDLSALPREWREAELMRTARVDALRPFRLDELPLVRWTLFRLAPDDHRLLAVEHHFVHDGWSFGVFLRELTAIYGAFAEGRPSPLAEPEIQFADYAAWQREWLRGDEARGHLEFWRRTLAGVPGALELPTDRPRPPELSFRGGSVRMRLSPRLAARAADFSRRQGVTLYTTLLAAFQALMGRLSGQSDFCLGVGVAGRSARETEAVIGMVVNTVPLRSDLAGNPEFGELLARVRRATMEAWAHQDVPFGEIVDAVQPERRLDRLPLYQVAFNFHHAPYPRLELPGLRLEVTEALGNGSSKFDLQVIAIPRGHQVAGAGEDDVTMIWEYASDLFDPETVERMHARYEAVLDAALVSPRTRLGELPLVLGEEGAMIRGSNETATDYPRDASLAHLFERAAAANPQAIALEDGARVETYASLNARANRLARHLAAFAAGPETRVGVCLERSADLVVAILAVVKTGAAYVTLDPAYPADRLAWMARDTKLSVLVSTRALAGGLGEVEVPAVLLDRDADAIERRDPDDLLGIPPIPDSLAYVVYTSGSTGTPKGIGISQRCIARLGLETDYAQLAPDDRVAQTANAAFDAFTWELWCTLLNGAALVIVPREVSLAPAALAEFVRARRITSMFLTTALFNQVAREVPDAYRPLRHVLFGGEAVDADAVRMVLRAGPPQRLLHMYGPSESTTYASWHLVREVPDDAATVPIGHPLANTTMHVLDGWMQPVPPGVPGELYVGGDGLARGYLGRAALTGERFVPDPFAERPGARMYRTGDRVRRLADGAVEFLGRVDRQVKVRGFRVEPGEIEAVLVRHPAVRDAVVEPVDSGPERELAAYVVAEEGEAPAAADLRAHLGAHLPAHMVPAAFVFLPAFPLTPNGKVDRRALPAPELDRAAAGTEFVAPRTPVEERLAAIWGEVLGTGEVGIDDDFFSLGGHSLRATRVATRIRDAFGVELTVRDLFESTTIRQLAMLVDGRMTPDETDLLAELEKLEGLTDQEVMRLLGEA
jgi:amino acid adenylation domain-containing protein